MHHTISPPTWNILNNTTAKKGCFSKWASETFNRRWWLLETRVCNWTEIKTGGLTFQGFPSRWLQRMMIPLQFILCNFTVLFEWSLFARIRSWLLYFAVCLNPWWSHSAVQGWIWQEPQSWPDLTRPYQDKLNLVRQGQAKQGYPRAEPV